MLLSMFEFIIVGKNEYSLFITFAKIGTQKGNRFVSIIKFCTEYS